MAIPIAEGSIKPQFQAPRAAQGKAVDFSQNIQQIGEQVANTIQGIQDFKTAQEEQTANDAITLYSYQMMNLNTKLKTMKGKDAVAFAPKYKEEAKKYHAQFLSNIGGTSSKVARAANDKINNFNMSNQEQFALYTEGERIESEGQSLDASHDALTSLHLEGYTGDALADAAKFYTFTKKCDEYALKKAALIGMASDPAYVLQKQKEARVVFMKQAVDKIIRENGNRKALAFLDLIEGYIPEDERWEIGRERSLSQLKIEVTKYPERFVKDGKINEAYLSDRYFPFLKPEDRLFAYHAAKKEKTDPKISDAASNFFIAEANKLVRDYMQTIWQNGLATNEMVASRIASFPATMDKEEILKTIQKEQKDNYKKYGDLASFVGLYADYLEKRSQTYSYANTGENTSNIFAYADGLKYQGRELETTFQSILKNLAIGAKGASTLEPGWFTSKDYSVKQYAHQIALDAALNAAGGDYSRIDMLNLEDAFVAIEKALEGKKLDGMPLKDIYNGSDLSSFSKTVPLDDYAKNAFLDKDGKEKASFSQFKSVILSALSQTNFNINTINPAYQYGSDDITGTRMTNNSLVAEAILVSGRTMPRENFYRWRR